MSIFDLGEMAQIPDGQQRMLINGVRMEEVMLHLSDDSAERRQETSKDPHVIHGHQCVISSGLAFDDFQESFFIHRIFDEGFVHQRMRSQEFS